MLRCCRSVDFSLWETGWVSVQPNILLSLLFEDASAENPGTIGQLTSHRQCLLSLTLRIFVWIKDWDFIQAWWSSSLTLSVVLSWVESPEHLRWAEYSVSISPSFRLWWKSLLIWWNIWHLSLTIWRGSVQRMKGSGAERNLLIMHKWWGSSHRS